MNTNLIYSCSRSAWGLPRQAPPSSQNLPGAMRQIEVLEGNRFSGLVETGFLGMEEPKVLPSLALKAPPAKSLWQIEFDSAGGVGVGMYIIQVEKHKSK